MKIVGLNIISHDIVKVCMAMRNEVPYHDILFFLDTGVIYDYTAKEFIHGTTFGARWYHLNHAYYPVYDKSGNHIGNVIDHREHSVEASSSRGFMWRGRNA